MLVVDLIGFFTTALEVGVALIVCVTTEAESVLDTTVVADTTTSNTDVAVSRPTYTPDDSTTTSGGSPLVPSFSLLSVAASASRMREKDRKHVSCIKHVDSEMCCEG